jgi:hypothetical protein
MGLHLVGSHSLVRQCTSHTYPGLCLAILSILFWKLLVKRRKAFTREKFWSLFGYLSFLTTLSCTCFLSAIRARVKHVSRFIRVAQVPAAGGGQIADINFDWWSGSFDTEITLQVNVILADVMLVNEYHLDYVHCFLLTYTRRHISFTSAGGTTSLFCTHASDCLSCD